MFLKKLILLLFTISAAAQEIPRVPKGIVTIMTGQKMPFVTLRMDDGQVVFFNTDSKSDYRYLPGAVARIVDNGGTEIYTNPKWTETEAKKESQKAEMLKNQQLESEHDGLYRPGFPDGIYLTRGSFVSKKPDETAELQLKIPGFFKNKPFPDIINYGSFFYRESDKQLFDAFAVCYRGCLYFRAGALTEKENLVKGDDTKTADDPYAFVRVLSGGENYFYMETQLTSDWAVGVSYSAGAVGQVVRESNKSLKGMVWSRKEQVFDIFRNCKDFNKFLSAHYPQGVKTCDSDIDLTKWAREIIPLLQ